MKKISKILMMFALAGFAACTNDTTEDLVQNVPGPELEKVTLNVSLLDTEVRTELGEKVGDKYPVYWSEGDAINVNGIPAEMILADGAERATTASFEVAAEAPFHIVYPHHDDLTKGDGAEQAVRFASEQSHTEGSFAPASSPMYACAESGDNITLNYLAGILRFALTSSENVVLSTITVSTDAPLAGDFDLDCSTGYLTAQEGKTQNEINYVFGEGEGALSTTAREFFVAIPAGEFGMFEVTFSTTDGKAMVAKFDGSTITPGVVREFKEAEFVNNSSIFLIYDEATLLQFATLVANNEFEDYEGAKVIKNITLSEDTVWTPIEGYSKLFDGGNKSISGLKAPLFGTTGAATIKNVKLLGQIIETSDLKVGILARELTEATVDNVTILEGSTIEYNNTTSNQIKGNFIYVGGVAGSVIGGTHNNITNYAALTMTQAGVSTTQSSTNYFGGVYGLVSYNSVDNTKLTSVKNITNHGAITWNNTTEGDTEYIGGCLGAITSQISSNVGTPTQVETENITNRGAVSVNKKDILTSTINCGGVVGSNLGVHLVKAYNYGALLFDTEMNYVYIGGVSGGNRQSASIIDCDNHGNVTFGANAIINSRAYLGGVVGYAWNDTTADIVVSNCTNSGVFTFNGRSHSGVKTVITNSNESRSYFGGVAGYAACRLESCENLASGTINIAGEIGSFLGTHVQKPSFGGIAGFVYGKKGELVNCTNHAAVNVSTKLVNNAEMFIGGVAGRVDDVQGRPNIRNNGQGTFPVGSSGCHNFGAVSFTGTTSYYTGAIVATDAAKDGTFVNTIDSSNTTVNGLNINVGGVFGITAVPASGCTNNADVSCTGSVAGNAYVGGVAAIVGRRTFYFTKQDNTTTDDGTTTTTTVTESQTYITTAPSVKGTLTSCSNSGKITCTSKVGAANSTIEHSEAVVGGVAGYASNDLTSCSNTGDIDFTYQTAETTAQVGGVVGMASSHLNYVVNYNDVTNSGHLNITGNVLPTSTVKNVGDSAFKPQNTSRQDYQSIYHRANFGGIIGRVLYYHGSSDFYLASGVKNTGNINLLTSGTTRWSNFAGIAGDVLVDIFGSTGTINEGAINIQAMNSTFACRFAGHVALMYTTAKDFPDLNQYTATFTNCINRGPITITETAKNSQWSIAGGIIGQAMSAYTDGEQWLKLTVENCVNEADGKIWRQSASSVTTGQETYSNAGGIIGALGSGQVGGWNTTNCGVMATITKCKNYAELCFSPNNGSASLGNTGRYATCVGGIIGLAYTGVVANYYFWTDITSCENHGKLTSYCGYAGGIAGVGFRGTRITGTETEPTVNRGEIKSIGSTRSYLGGIAGALRERVDDGTNSVNSDKCRIDNSINYANVTGSYMAGGIVGENTSFALATSTASSQNGRDYLGGIHDCTNAGTVTCTTSNSAGSISGGATTQTDVKSRVVTFTVNNCKVGGKVSRSNGTAVALTADNYFDYIYNCAWNLGETTPAYGGNTFYTAE